MTHGRPWCVDHSITINVTWWRFDQSAKQLIVGHTIKFHITWQIASQSYCDSSSSNADKMTWSIFNLRWNCIIQCSTTRCRDAYGQCSGSQQQQVYSRAVQQSEQQLQLTPEVHPFPDLQQAVTQNTPSPHTQQSTTVKKIVLWFI